MKSDHSEKPNILITGGSGLIGARLAEMLSPRYTVIGLDVEPPKAESNQIHWLDCDLTESESVLEAFGRVRDRFGQRLTSVIHLAAYYDFSGAPSPLYRDLTVEGTRRLLSGLQTFEVEQIIFSSSLLVMEAVEDKNDVITEESPVEAEWDYPRSKLEAETALLNEHGETPIVILRIAGVYNDDCRSIPLGRHIARIYEKDLESYLFPGEAEHGQPFIHLDDLAHCFKQVVEKRMDLENEEIFLIAEPSVLSHVDLQNRLGELIHGKEWPTIHVPKLLAKAGAWAKDKLTSEEEFIKPWMIDLADAHYPVEITKVRNRLGWTPKHNLRDRLDTIVDRLKKNPRRWYEKNDLPLPEFLEEETVTIEEIGARS